MDKRTPKAGEIWEYFKGGEYRIIAPVLNKLDGQLYIVYRSIESLESYCEPMQVFQYEFKRTEAASGLNTFRRNLAEIISLMGNLKSECMTPQIEKRLQISLTWQKLSRGQLISLSIIWKKPKRIKFISCHDGREIISEYCEVDFKGQKLRFVLTQKDIREGKKKEVTKRILKMLEEE